MQTFKIGVPGLLTRFYLTMGLTFLAGYTANWWIMALTIPIFISLFFMDHPKDPKA